MKLPWVSRELYELALKQIEELKASNAQLLELALTKQVEPEKKEEPEEMSTKPRRPLGIDIRKKATQWASERAAASPKPSGKAK